MQHLTEFGEYSICVIAIGHPGTDPASPRGYNGYLCKKGDEDSRDVTKKLLFSQPMPSFQNEDAACRAGVEEAKQIIRGVHPTRNIGELKA